MYEVKNISSPVTNYSDSITSATVYDGNNLLKKFRKKIFFLNIRYKVS